jgi:hypothetical protein
VSELNIVPLTINYERTMESGLYSNELLGERKVKESLKNLLRSSPILNSNFGNITVRFAAPISVRRFAEGYLQHHHRLLQSSSSSSSAAASDSSSSSSASASTALVTASSSSSSSSSAASSSSSSSSSLAGYAKAADPAGAARRGVVRALAFRVVHELNAASECMPTHLVAALMLMYVCVLCCVRGCIQNILCGGWSLFFHRTFLCVLFFWCLFCVCNGWLVGWFFVSACPRIWSPRWCSCMCAK